MIYISGGITGVKDYMDKFDKAEKMLSEKYAVVNPARLNKSHKDKPWAWYMRRCLKWLCDCDTIYMLNGWEKSKGAMMEYSIAKELGLQIIYEGDL